MKKSTNKNKECLNAQDNDIQTDPLGSWTGVPENPYEKPIQDADDL